MISVLCVATKNLPQDFKVNRNVNLEEILMEAAYFKEPGRGYLPLDMCTSIRSMYDNTVLAIRDGKHTLYYVNMVDIPMCRHFGYDMLMYESSLALLECVNYDTEIDYIMAKHSQFQPIGLYYPPGTVLNPIMYSHIILSDVGMKLLEPHLKTNVGIAPIENLSYWGNLAPLLDTLVVVKEEHHE